MFTVERDGEVAVIRFNNPPVNAISFAHWGEFPGVIAELERSAVAAMVFTGLPQKHFCGGNDFRGRCAKAASPPLLRYTVPPWGPVLC